MTSAPLDHATCYSASSGRDARFDGQFVMAVRTTGIYCRPSCPARKPKSTNVEFFRTSAAAHLAGYRACKRCLPEAVPGSPEWSMREDVAARAMRLISEGVVDREGVSGLASRLGYSERHLGRALIAELGAGPLALARAQRAQNARHLLVGTDLSMADVAFGAGFASIRQFNDTIAEVFGMAPSAVRATARRQEQGSRDGTRSSPHSDDATHGTRVTVRLAAREPFDGAGVLDWLAARAIGSIETVDDGVYSRSVMLARGPAVLAISPTSAGIDVTAELTALADLPEALSRARRLFDLDADPHLIDGALVDAARDFPQLSAALADRPGIRMPGALEPTEMVVRAILGQQVTVAAARTALMRLVEATARALPPPFSRPGVTHAFPDAATVAHAAASDAVRGPEARKRALAAACIAMADGAVRLDAGVTREELTSSLERLPGIGPWTSNYVAFRVLGSTDVFLTGDVAVRNGAALLGLPREPRELLAASAPFAPWRSYLMLHLWRAAARPVSPGGTA